VSKLDIAAAVKGNAQRLEPMDSEKYQWKLRTTLKKAKNVKINKPSAELRTLSQLEKYISFAMLPLGKRNATAVAGTEQT
jgi:hypothetical protein